MLSVNCLLGDLEVRDRIGEGRCHHLPKSVAHLFLQVRSERSIHPRTLLLTAFALTRDPVFPPTVRRGRGLVAGEGAAGALRPVPVPER